MSSNEIIDLNAPAPKAGKSKHKRDAVRVAGQILEQLEELNKNFACCLYGSKFFIARFEDDDIHLMSVDDFRAWLNNQHYYDEEGEAKKISSKWLSWHGRRQYNNIVFKPAYDLPSDVYNQWRGFAFTPYKDAGQYNKFLKHVYDNIAAGNPVIYEWILDWVADLIQKPERKSWTAIILKSAEEGTGKGFFARQIGLLFGYHFMALERARQLTGNFNSHLEDKILLFVDEGSLTDDSAADFLKALVTEPTLNIEGKGKPIRQVKSYHRLIIASNRPRIIQAGLHDRRYLVCEVGGSHKNDLAYFREIEEELQGGEAENGGYEALMWFFVNRKYNEDSIRIPPKTNALMDQKLQSMSDEMTWWHECLWNGKIGNSDFRTTSTMNTEDFMKVYIEWCNQQRIQKRLNNVWLIRSLNEHANACLESKSGGTANSRYYPLPSLGSARECFEAKIGHTIKWEE